MVPPPQTVKKMDILVAHLEQPTDIEKTPMGPKEDSSGVWIERCRIWDNGILYTLKLKDQWYIRRGARSFVLPSN